MSFLADPAVMVPSAAPLAAARLQRGLVQVWFVQTPCALGAAPCLDIGVLSPDERRRADSFAFEQDRIDYVGAHVALRFLLASCLRAAPESLLFTWGAEGKPKLAGAHENTALRFNLSHTRGLAACVLAMEREVGVDVEWVDRSMDTLAVGARAFCVETGRRLLELDQTSRTNTFFRLWTCMEAFAKATGMGLEESARQTCRAAIQAGAACVDGGATDFVTLQWRLRSLACPEGYAGAVVAADTDWTLETHACRWV